MFTKQQLRLCLSHHCLSMMEYHKEDADIEHLLKYMMEWHAATTDTDHDHCKNTLVIIYIYIYINRVPERNMKHTKSQHYAAIKEYFLVKLTFKCQLRTGNSIHFRITKGCSWESIGVFETEKCLAPGRTLANYYIWKRNLLDAVVVFRKLLL